MNVRPINLAAVILAAGLSATIIILAISEYTHEGHLTSDEANTITAVLSAIVGALATYLGVRGNGEHTPN